MTRQVFNTSLSQPQHQTVQYFGKFSTHQFPAGLKVQLMSSNMETNQVPGSEWPGWVVDQLTAHKVNPLHVGCSSPTRREMVQSRAVVMRVSIASCSMLTSSVGPTLEFGKALEALQRQVENSGSSVQKERHCFEFLKEWGTHIVKSTTVGGQNMSSVPHKGMSRNGELFGFGVIGGDQPGLSERDAWLQSLHEFPATFRIKVDPIWKFAGEGEFVDMLQGSWSKFLDQECNVNTATNSVDTTTATATDDGGGFSGFDGGAGDGGAGGLPTGAIIGIIIAGCVVVVASAAWIYKTCHKETPTEQSVPRPAQLPPPQPTSQLSTVPLSKGGLPLPTQEGPDTMCTQAKVAPTP